MKIVEVILEDYLYEFYKKVGEQAGGMKVQQVLSLLSSRPCFFVGAYTKCTLTFSARRRNKMHRRHSSAPASGADGKKKEAFNVS